MSPFTHALSAPRGKVVTHRERSSEGAFALLASGRVVEKHDTHRAGTHDSGSQTRRNGTGQLPACDLVGWLKTEAEGCRELTGSAHTVYPQGGEAASYLPLNAQGKGGCRVKLQSVQSDAGCSKTGQKSIGGKIGAPRGR